MTFCEVNSDSDDSSSEDEDTSIFQSICDPRFSANYSANTKSKTNVTTPSVAVEQVTGDKDLDKIIHGVKGNMANVCDGSFASCNGAVQLSTGTVLISRKSSNLSDRMATLGTKPPVPYLLKFFAKVMNKQIEIINENSISPATSSRRLSIQEQNDTGSSSLSDDSFADSNRNSYISNDKSTLNNGHLLGGNGLTNSSNGDQTCDIPNATDTDTLMLLPNLTYDPSAILSHQHNKGSDEWIKNLKRQQGCFYDSDEESDVESRCRAVALPHQFIASGGLKSSYAEHRNKNPLKVQRVRLLKKGSGNGILRIAPLLPKKEKQAKKQTSVNVKLEDTGDGIKASSNAGGTKEPHASLLLPQVNLNNGEQSIKRKKVKSRKRGNKKNKKINVESTQASVESSSVVTINVS